MATFDVIIVGGGSAGITLAARLSEDSSRSVLLIEAGSDGGTDAPEDRLANVSFALTARDWGMRASIAPGRELDYPQGRALGGGSAVNGGLAFRGIPQDYDDWAAAGNPSWTWDQMLPCFRRLERDREFGTDAGVHGDSGPVSIVRWSTDELLPVQRGFVDASTALGFAWNADHNHPGTEGVGPFPMNRDGDIRISTRLAYLTTAHGRRNLTVWPDSHVGRIEITGGRAVGVEVIHDGRLQTVHGGEVVISCGSIHSPALLARSGIGPSETLRALGIECRIDNPAVGANLVDHPGAFVFARPVAGGVGPVDPQYQVAIRCTSKKGTPSDLFVSMMNNWDLSVVPDFAAIVGADSVVALTCGVHDPLSRGRVTLTSSDPMVPPRIELNLLDHPLDVARMIEGLRLCRAIAEHEAMSPFLAAVTLPTPVVFDDDDALEAYARSMVAGWYHPVGTCRMGPTLEGGSVVDDHLRVHGVEALRVVDASIMPRITKAPTNLTAIAIGERAADLIRSE